MVSLDVPRQRVTTDPLVVPDIDEQLIILSVEDYRQEHRAAGVDAGSEKLFIVNLDQWTIANHEDTPTETAR